MGFKYISAHKCRLCKVQHEVDTPYEERDFLQRLIRWQEGESIQRAFPELRPEKREIIQSGHCNDSWNAIFPEGAEDEEGGGEVPKQGAEEDKLPF